MTSNVLSVVRVGPLSVDLDDVSICCNRLITDPFIQSIRDYYNNNSNVDDSSNENDAAVDSISLKNKNILNLSNKYFSSKVLLEETFLPIENNTVTTNTNQEVNVKEDGIILVFIDDNSMLRSSSNDAQHKMTSSSLFDTLQNVHERSIQYNMAGDLLRLCVGINFGTKCQYPSTNEYEKEYSRRILWCLDHGYEYVEADISPSGLTTGHNERDKDGFARIIEAISGTVWSSAIMSPKKQQELKVSYQNDLHQTKKDGPISSNQTVPHPPTKADVVESLPSLEEQSGGEQSVDVDDVITNVKTKSLNSHDGDDVVTSVNPFELKDDDGTTENIVTSNDDPNEQRLQSLEIAIQEAKKIRDLSTSGILSDEERRKRAGDAALVLLNMMGMDMDDSEDEMDHNNNDNNGTK